MSKWKKSFKLVATYGATWLVFFIAMIMYKIVRKPDTQELWYATIVIGFITSLPNIFLAAKYMYNHAKKRPDD